MLTAKEINAKIIAIYEKWREEIAEKSPQLLGGGFSKTVIQAAIKESK